MDVKDKRILYELSTNARIPLTKLAKKVHLSASSTARRIQKLENDRTITGLHPIIDNSTLGYQGYRAYLKFSGTTPRQEEQVLVWLQEQDEVSVLGEARGAYDAIIMSWVRRADEFHTLIQELKKRYRDKIQHIDAFTYLRTHHYTRAYLLGKKHNKKTITIGNAHKAEHDELDKKILAALIQDARKSALEISEEINEQSRTVLNRLRKLEKERIIAGYGANVALENIGCNYYKLNLVLEENVEYTKLLGYAQQLPNTIYVDETIGRYDFEINVEVRDTRELDKIIDELKELTGGLKEIEIFEIKKYRKLTYLKTP